MPNSQKKKSATSKLPPILNPLTASPSDLANYSRHINLAQFRGAAASYKRMNPRFYEELVRFLNFAIVL
jgi:hypothetical protein